MSTEQTRSVVQKYFTDLANGDADSAMAALSEDIVFELPQDQWNVTIPYLGKHVGVQEVVDAFGVRAATTEVLDYALRDVRADGDVAYAIIYTKAAQTRTRQEFEIVDAHRLTVGDDGKITSWTCYFDPNGELAAFNVDREQRLVEAVWNADTDTLAEVLRDGGDVNTRDADTGLTPLMIAAGLARPDLVRTLLDAGADVYTSDPGGGATALHKACQGGSVEVVEQLLDAGAFVDAVAVTTGHTPLMDALWFKFPEIAKVLMDRGAGMNLSTHYGFSLIEHFEYELNVNKVGKERLQLADKYVKERTSADEAAAASADLMNAVTAGDVDKVRDLLDAGTEVDKRYPIVNSFNDWHTPLLVATRDGHLEIARLLIEAGADVNAVEPTFGAVPLHKAVYNGHPEMTELVAKQPGVDLNFQGATNGYTPLHDSIWHGFDDCASVVLDAGARLDLRGHDGKRPLDVAVEVFGDDHPLTRRIAAATG